MSNNNEASNLPAEIVETTLVDKSVQDINLSLSGLMDTHISRAKGYSSFIDKLTSMLLSEKTLKAYENNPDKLVDLIYRISGLETRSLNFISKMVELSSKNKTAERLLQAYLNPTTGDAIIKPSPKPLLPDSVVDEVIRTLIQSNLK